VAGATFDPAKRHRSLALTMEAAKTRMPAVAA
jgi:hypothetical protein